MSPMRIWAAFACLLTPLLSVAQYPNIRVSLPTSTTPNEVTLSINPANPVNLIAGANLRYVYRSVDGGFSWSEGQITSSYGVWGDPCVIFDGSGDAYYAHLSRPPDSIGKFLDRIVVQKSIDGGLHWNDGVGIGLNPPKHQDKEWLAADMTSSVFHGYLYCAWTEFDSISSPFPSDSSRILFARSTDAGASWSVPVRVSDRGGDCLDGDNTVEGAVPAIGPNGEVYVSWSGPLGILFDKSSDGGNSWGADISVASQPGGWDFDVSGIYRCNGLPVTACDVSSSLYRGRIYVLWSDQRNGLEDTDIFLVHSKDGGMTWSQPRRVNDDMTARHQFFPWLSVDQSNGDLYLVFYDRRETVGDTTDVYVAKSSDGGETFTNFKVSATPFVPTAGIFFGDYTNIAVSNKKAFPIWMRLDSGVMSVWTALVQDAVAVEGEVFRHAPGELSLQSYPNPFNSSTSIRFRIPSGPGSSQIKAVIRVYDVLGRECGVIFEGEVTPGDHEVSLGESAAGIGRLGSGLYFLRLTAAGQSAVQRLMLIK